MSKAIQPFQNSWGRLYISTTSVDIQGLFSYNLLEKRSKRRLKYFLAMQRTFSSSWIFLILIHMLKMPRAPAGEIESWTWSPRTYVVITSGNTSTNEEYSFLDWHKRAWLRSILNTTPMTRSLVSRPWLARQLTNKGRLWEVPVVSQAVGNCC